MTKPPRDGEEAGPESNPASSEPVDIGTERARRQKVMGDGTGGGTWGLDARVAKLEAHTEHMQADLGEIKTLLGNLGSQFRHLPTKQDLTNNVLAMVAIGLTVFVLAVGSIIGGLDFIQHHAPAEVPPTAPAPMIFQLPAQAPVAPQAIVPAPKPAKPR